MSAKRKKSKLSLEGKASRNISPTVEKEEADTILNIKQEAEDLEFMLLGIEKLNVNVDQKTK